MKPTVIIHSNRKQLLGARVAAFSMKSRSRCPERFDVRIICAENFPQLQSKHGRTYLRDGKAHVWDTSDLQSFTPLRFLPPQLLNFEGRVLITDPDVFAVGDVWDLLGRELSGKAILCRRIRPTDGRSEYWGTSVMLLDCSKLRHWNWDAQLEALFSYTIDYSDWISLKLENEASIDELEPEWNAFDTLTKETKLLHNTGRLTQPWKTGLKIDFQSTSVPQDNEKKWGVIPKQWAWRLRKWIYGSDYLPPTHYQRHPDPAQESFFFDLLGEAIASGEVRETEVEAAILKKEVRTDLMALLTSRGGDEARL